MAIEYMLSNHMNYVSQSEQMLTEFYLVEGTIDLKTFPPMTFSSKAEAVYFLNEHPGLLMAKYKPRIFKWSKDE